MKASWMELNFLLKDLSLKWIGKRSKMFSRQFFCSWCCYRISNSQLHFRPPPRVEPASHLDQQLSQLSAPVKLEFDQCSIDKNRKVQFQSGFRTKSDSHAWLEMLQATIKTILLFLHQGFTLGFSVPWAQIESGFLSTNTLALRRMKDQASVHKTPALQT